MRLFPRFSFFNPFFLYNRDVESYDLQSFSFSRFNCRIIKRLAFKDALQVFKRTTGFLLRRFIYRTKERSSMSSIMRTTSSFLSNRSIELSIESFLLGDNLKGTSLLFPRFSPFLCYLSSHPFIIFFPLSLLSFALQGRRRRRRSNNERR